MEGSGRNIICLEAMRKPSWTFRKSERLCHQTSVPIGRYFGEWRPYRTVCRTASIYGSQLKPYWHISYISKYNQQDATLHNLFISVKCCTCIRRFLRPSSGAQNCIYSIGYFAKPLLLPATVVEEMKLLAVPFLPRQWQVAAQVWQRTRCCIYSFELLMMGGGTAWYIYSISHK